MVFPRCLPLWIPVIAREIPRVAAFLTLLGPLEAAPEPRRGDVDGDGSITITDGTRILDFLFLSAPAPYCTPVADVNDDGDLNISDPVRLLNHIFLGGTDLPGLGDGEVNECSSNNLPPILPERPIYRAYPGFLVEFTLGAVDPEGDRLRYEAAELPAGASMDPDSGLFRWTPGEGNLGPIHVLCTVIDEGRPPNRVEGQLVFEVLPPDPCDRPMCDPTLGCEPRPIEDLTTECCGDPGPRIPDPDIGCPEGAVLHVGRNSVRASTIGRLKNCDGLRVAALAQGGFGVHLNFEMRCLDPADVSIQVRLETASAVIVDRQRQTFLEERPDGYLEKRSMGFNTEDLAAFPDGTEGRLTVIARDGTGMELERRVRVVLTTQPLEDLP